MWLNTTSMITSNPASCSARTIMITSSRTASAPCSCAVRAIDDRDVTKHDADPSHPHVPWSKTVIYELHVKGRNDVTEVTACPPL